MRRANQTRLTTQHRPFDALAVRHALDSNVGFRSLLLFCRTSVPILARIDSNHESRFLFDQTLWRSLEAADGAHEHEWDFFEARLSPLTGGRRPVWPAGARRTALHPKAGHFQVPWLRLHPVTGRSTVCVKGALA